MWRVRTWDSPWKHPQAEGRGFLSASARLPEEQCTRFIGTGVLCFVCVTQSSTDLMYVLAEGWNSGELTDEVEVGGGDCVNGTAVERRQSLVSRQGQVLDGRKGERSSWIMWLPVKRVKGVSTCKASASRMRSTTTSSLASSMLRRPNSAKRAS